MTTDRLRRARDLYLSLLDLPPEQRLAALDRECTGEPALRSEVASLLAHTDSVGDFLTDPALGKDFSLAADALPPPEDDLVGQQVGPYRIEKRLAAGGMGAVYLASRADKEFTQQVAVKVVKRGMDSEEILGRFKRERRTLAALNHPNIARLMDGGATRDGRPYLVMEYVEGVPLADFCRGLTIPHTLLLFEKICDAVSFAHRNLVIHRDLKPSNILVTAEGEPKLLDFGIATVLAEQGGAHSTMASERRLTPEYASPEQVLGKPVATTTDVYSLGIILYELLSGARPYRFQTYAPSEVERMVCHEPVQPPSAAALAPAGPDGGFSSDTPPTVPTHETGQKLARRLRGDLDTIVLMALRKEPERRYSSVEQFAGDVRRYLENRPVIARKDTFAYRARKFVRRNALGVGFTAGTLLLLVLGSIGIAWQAQIARDQRDAAYLARDQSEMANELLEGMLTAASPFEKLGPDVPIRAVVDEAAIRLDTEWKDKPPLVRAAVRSGLGKAYLGLGDTDRAEHLITQAYEDRRAILGDNHHDVAESKMDLAQVRYINGDFKRAETLLREALALHQAQRGKENLDTARVYNDLGAVLRAAHKPVEAGKALDTALTIRRRLEGENSLNVAETLNNLAYVELEKKDTKKAISHAEAALAIRRKQLPATHPLIAQSIQNAAALRARDGDFASAETGLREALAILGQTLTPAHVEIARTLRNLGAICRRNGHPKDAVEFLERAVPILAAAPEYGPADPFTLSTRLELARAHNDLLAFALARQIAAEVLAASPENSDPHKRVREDAAKLIAEIDPKLAPSPITPGG